MFIKLIKRYNTGTGSNNPRTFYSYRIIPCKKQQILERNKTTTPENNKVLNEEESIKHKNILKH